MTDSAESTQAAPPGPDLHRAIREVKNDLADRDDVVVELRETQRTRLELLAEELAPVFSQVSAEDDRFDFAISSGTQPRLWIDAVAHVAMGRDRRSYRFVRDTRLGRVVLAESLDMKAVAERVTRYVAERVVERQRQIEGDAEPAARVGFAAESGNGGETMEPAPSEAAPTGPQESEPAAAGRTSAFLKGFGILLLGMAAGAAIVAVLAWERVVAYFGMVNP